MTSLELLPEEIRIAAHIGIERQLRGLECAANGGSHRYNFDGPGWDIHIEGAIAECAVAKFFHWYWNDRPYAKGDDDVGDWQVRHTRRHDGRLIVHPEDPDDKYFVLVTGSAPMLEIRGYLAGADCKRPEYWREDGVRFPAFFVPQYALRDL